MLNTSIKLVGLAGDWTTAKVGRNSNLGRGGTPQQVQSKYLDPSIAQENRNKKQVLDERRIKESQTENGIYSTGLIGSVNVEWFFEKVSDLVLFLDRTIDLRRICNSVTLVYAT